MSKVESLIEFGVCQGRFQIVHNGHVEYFSEAKRKCRHLIVGISDYDPENSYFDYKKYKDHSLNPFRTINEPHHAFTYLERYLMIKVALVELGMTMDDFSIVPFPVHHPHLIKYYIPKTATIFITIYGAWGHEKKSRFEKLGYKTNVMWERTMEERFTSGDEVRRLLAGDGDWNALVPDSVEKKIRELGLDEEIKKIKVE